MMEKKFSKELLKSIDKVPVIDNVFFLSFMFSIIYPREKPGKPKNVLTARYEAKKDFLEIELLIQSPRDEALKKSDLADFKSVIINGNKFYIGYKPDIEFFPGNKALKLYTTVIGEDVVTFAVKGIDDLKKAKTGETMRIRSKIIRATCDIPDRIGDFVKCNLIFNRSKYKGHIYIMFLNTKKKTKINMEMFEDENELVGEIIRDVIRNKKRVYGPISEGKVAGQKILFYRTKNDLLLTSRLTGKDEQLIKKFMRKLVKYLK